MLRRLLLRMLIASSCGSHVGDLMAVIKIDTLELMAIGCEGLQSHVGDLIAVFNIDTLELMAIGCEATSVILWQ